MAGNAPWLRFAESCTPRWLLARCLRAKAGAELADPSAVAARVCPSLWERQTCRLPLSLPSLLRIVRAAAVPMLKVEVWGKGARGQGSAAPPKPLARCLPGSPELPPTAGALLPSRAQGGRTGCTEDVPPALPGERR